MVGGIAISEITTIKGRRANAEVADVASKSIDYKTLYDTKYECKKRSYRKTTEAIAQTAQTVAKK